MDARLLVQLAVAVDLGSLNQAASRLNVTQPTLSRAIKVIEDRVGAPVLVRESYGVVPTEIGERLAARGRAVLAETEHADSTIRQWRDGRKTELGLGIGPLLSATLVPRLAERSITEKWPYTLRMQCASAEPLIQMLNEERLDLVLAPAQLRLHQESLTQNIVFPDKLVIVAGAKSDLLDTGKTISRAALENANWIVAGAHAGIHGTETEVFKFLNIKPRRLSLTVSGDLAIPLHLLKTTDVLAALPERLFKFWGDVGGAKILKVDFPEIRRDISLWSRKVDRNKTYLLHFKEVLKQHLKDF